MSDTTILGLTTATGVDYDNDYIPGVDVSDTTETADGTTKKFTPKVILKGKDLPSGTIVGTTDTQTLTGKTINDDNNVLSNIATSALKTKSGSDDTVITGTAGTNGDLSQWNADGDLVDGPTPPTGDIVGTTDTQTLTNKTLTTPTLTTPKVDTISEATSGSGVTIDGLLLKDGDIDLNTGNLAGGLVTLDDDEAASFTPGKTIGVMLIYGRATGYKANYGLVSYRIAATNYTQLMITGTDIEVTTGALAGTTGTDAKFTVSADSTTGMLYIENRLGASRSFGYLLLGE